MLLRCRRILGLGLPFALLAAAPSHAAPLDLISDSRRVYAATEAANIDGDVAIDWPQSSAPTPFVEWIETVGTSYSVATQTSVATPLLVTGSGSASTGRTTFPYDPPGYFSPEDAWSASTFSLTFGVSEPTAIDLSGVFFAEHSREIYARSSYSLRDLGSMLDVSSYGIRGHDGLQEFHFQTVLEPGEYQLYVATLVDDFIFSPGDSSFSFALVVPEPGTGPLLGCAIAGLLAARRRTPRRAPGPASA